MRARGCIGGWGLVCLLVGVACGDDGSGDGGTTAPTDSSGGQTTDQTPNVAPTVVAEVDVTAACGGAGATRVELHATRVACINPPPAPCTLPATPRPTVGEGVDCPAEASPQSLRVELEQTGRYHVEVLTLAGETELQRVCHGENGETELLITAERLDAKPTLMVDPLDGSACD